MTRPRAFRFDPSLLRALEDRARERNEATTALAERYLREGLRRDDHPLIDFRDGAAGRRPALVGTRLDVGQVVDTLRDSDNSVSAAAEYFDVPEPFVDAAVRYYAEFRGEVDAWRRRMHAIADREQGRRTGFSGSDR